MLQFSGFTQTRSNPIFQVWPSLCRVQTHRVGSILPSLFFTNTTCKEEGWILAILCGLLTTQKHHCQGQVPYPNHWWAARWVGRCLLFLKIRSQIRLLSNQSTSHWHWEDGLSNTWYALSFWSCHLARPMLHLLFEVSWMTSSGPCCDDMSWYSLMTYWCIASLGRNTWSICDMSYISLVISVVP